MSRVADQVAAGSTPLWMAYCHSPAYRDRGLEAFGAGGPGVQALGVL